MGRQQKEKEDRDKATVALSIPEDAPSYIRTGEQFDDTEDIVQQELLDKLSEKEKLKEMLENPHLQTILRHANSTDLPEKVMRDAMQEPIFLEFADTCLRAVEPDKYADEAEMDYEL